MKQEETGNLSRDELFEKIKRKCISRARVDFYGGLIFFIIFIASFILPIYRGKGLFDDANFFSSIIAIAFVCMMGCVVLYSYWNKKKIEKMDNPSQFLHYYENKSQILIIITLVLCLIWLGMKFADFIKTATFDFEHVLLAIVFVASAYLFFQIYKTSSVNFRDMEIIEQLRDLIDKK